MTGVDLATVKELLGHKTLTMTLRHARRAPAHKVKAVDILDNALNEKPTIQELYSQGATRLTKREREMLFYTHSKARSSGGERYLDTVEVPGSKPGGPTI